MKSCNECEFLMDIIGKSCVKKWEISKHNSNGYNEYFNDEVFWKNIILGFDINCPDFKQIIYQKDPYG
jgi:hypothetical protein